ncbi:MAG: FtsX-like permease family protein [Oligoflexales bacterium]
MSFSHFVAIRYLKASRDNRFFSWISILSITGLAIGVAALIVVLSVIDGFEHELRVRFLHVNAHIMAYRYPSGLVEPDSWAANIKKEFPKDVSAVSPFIHYETMAKHGSLTHGVIIRGTEPKVREKVQPISQLITPQHALDQLQEENDRIKTNPERHEIPKIIVGTGLLGILNVKVGEEIEVIPPGGIDDTGSNSFKIVGVYNSGLQHYDDRLIIMSLETARNFFDMGKTVTGLEIGLFDPMQSIPVKDKLESKFNLTFKEWQSFNSNLFDAMEKERQVIALIVALVVLVAAFNILTTIFVSVSQKQRDISVLKALGATNGQVVKLFVNQSLYIGVIGALIGLVLAFVISKALETYQFIDLPDPYFLKSLPVHYSPWVYAGISGAAILLCVVAGLYPSFIAARVKPTDGFREIGEGLA